jgi:glucosamine-phosphate N-acetyltransferase
MDNFEFDTLYNIYEKCQLYENSFELIEDIKSQYLHLLSFLTETKPILREEFIRQIIKISEIGDIMICYLKDSERKITILGSGTIIYEPKIIHGCKNVGHIEDIVVHENYRGQGIAQKILVKLTNNANYQNCYKVILDCKNELVPFYEKMGFIQNNYQMTKYFNKI